MLKLKDFIDEEIEEGKGAISIKTRIGRKLSAIKSSGKRKAGAKRFKKRKADAKRISMRAGKQTRKDLFKRFAKGKPKSKMSAAQKRSIEARVDKLTSIAARMKRRLIPVKRKADLRR